MAIKKSGFKIDIDKIPQLFAGIQALSNVPPGATWDVLAGGKTVDQSLDDTARDMKRQQLERTDQSVTLPSIVPDMNPFQDDYLASLGIIDPMTGGMSPIPPDFGMTPPENDPLIEDFFTEEVQKIIAEETARRMGGSVEGYGFPEIPSWLTGIGEGSWEALQGLPELLGERFQVPPRYGSGNVPQVPDDFSFLGGLPESIISNLMDPAVALGPQVDPWTGDIIGMRIDQPGAEEAFTQDMINNMQLDPATMTMTVDKDGNVIETGDMNPDLPSGTYFLHQLFNDPATVSGVGADLYVNFFYDNESMFDDSVAKGVEDFFKERSIESPVTGGVSFRYDTYGEGMDDSQFTEFHQSNPMVPTITQGPNPSDLEYRTTPVTSGGYVPSGPSGPSGPTDGTGIAGDTLWAGGVLGTESESDIFEVAWAATPGTHQYQLEQMKPTIKSTTDMLYSLMMPDATSYKEINPTGHLERYKQHVNLILTKGYAGAIKELGSIDNAVSTLVENFRIQESGGEGSSAFKNMTEQQRLQYRSHIYAFYGQHQGFMNLVRYLGSRGLPEGFKMKSGAADVATGVAYRAFSNGQTPYQVISSMWSGSGSIDTAPAEASKTQGTPVVSGTQPLVTETGDQGTDTVTSVSDTVTGDISSTTQTGMYTGPDWKTKGAQEAHEEGKRQGAATEAALMRQASGIYGGGFEGEPEIAGGAPGAPVISPEEVELLGMFNIPIEMYARMTQPEKQRTIKAFSSFPDPAGVDPKTGKDRIPGFSR